MTAGTLWVRRAAMGLAAVLAAVLVASGGVYEAIQYGGNVHVVEPTQVIRSAQPTGTRLDEFARRYAIRSVLNLRGNNAGQPWYDEEIVRSNADGLVHFDYALSAEHDVTPAQLNDLLRLIAAAPKPLLIHCNAGADRTGLISAVYEVSIGTPAGDAARQLSLRYGHFPYLWSKTDAMDRSYHVFVAQRAASAP